MIAGAPGESGSLVIFNSSAETGWKSTALRRVENAIKTLATKARNKGILSAD
jgi:hypothetical protein